MALIASAVRCMRTSRRRRNCWSKRCGRTGGGSVKRSVAALAVVAVTAVGAGVLTGPGAAAGTRAAHAARAAAPAAAGGTWGTAEEVPGTAALSQGGTAQVTSVSCPTAGSCGAVGFYSDPTGPFQAFVVSKADGTWGTAAEAPGTAALNQGGNAAMGSVSCASAGNCSAGGSYVNSLSYTEAFVISETNGSWRQAKEVPGTAALNRGHMAVTNSVSCPSAGNCSAGGYYTDSSDHQQAFVISEVNGSWGTAVELPGIAALNAGGSAEITSVSCASAGNCSAGGYYTDASGKLQVFVAGQANGAWHPAIEVPGTAALNQDGRAVINSVSCRSAGNCSAGGSYTQITADEQAFVVTETNGTWGTAEEVPGTAALNTGGSASTLSVSCASAGNCSAGGSYLDSSGDQPFVVSETGGTWGSAEPVPGVAALDQGATYAATTSLSCASAGNCSAGGVYTDIYRHQQVFVVSQTDGSWGSAEEVPGTASLNTGGYAVINSVSCSSVAHCSAGGYYTESIGGGFGNPQAFVVNQS
jgi:hypothetical protein